MWTPRYLKLCCQQNPVLPKPPSVCLSGSQESTCTVKCLIPDPWALWWARRELWSWMLNCSQSTAISHSSFSHAGEVGWWGECVLYPLLLIGWDGRQTVLSPVCWVVTGRCQPFKALHHRRGECHWAAVIQASWSCFLGHRNDVGLEACGYDRLIQEQLEYHCEHQH